MKYNVRSEKDILQQICFFSLLYNHKDHYHLLNGTDYKLVSSDGKLLADNNDLKRYWLITVGVFNWKRLYAFIERCSGSGGFLTHIGKESCHFSINYNLSLPFKMTAIKISDKNKLVSYYLSIRRNREKYLSVIKKTNLDFFEFINRVDNQLINENKIGGEKVDNQNLKEFSEELFKSISVVFESFWHQHRKHYVDTDVFKEFQNLIKVEVDGIKKSLISLKQGGKHIDTNLKLLEQRVNELSKLMVAGDEKFTANIKQFSDDNCVRDKNIDLIKQKVADLEILSEKQSEEIDSLFSKLPKQKKEPLKEKVYISEKFPFLAELVKKYTLY